MPRRSLRPTEPDPTSPRRRALVVFALAVLPSVAAIWTVPCFLTQDNPAHLYNAHIVAQSLQADSPFQDVYSVHWDPLPNWAGHLAMLGLLSFLPASTADRVVMTVTLVGFAVSLAWLRWRVAGWRGMSVASALAVLLALNVTWLLGFTSFLLGACLVPIALGVWWAGRERFGAARALVLAGLLVVIYFCHLVSLGVTAIGLVILAVTTPGPGWRRRLLWTSASLAPLVVMGVIYRGLTKSGGGFAPDWGNLKTLWSPGSWSAQLSWVDPISLGSKMVLPFIDVRSRWCGLLAPVALLTFALLFIVAATVFRPRGPADTVDSVPERHGWALLATVLLLGGALGPDTFGRSHGHYLSQQIFLLGLAALIPFLKLDGRQALVAAGAWTLGAAVAMQSAILWDYALYSNRLAGPLALAKPFVGERQRVGTLLIDNRALYRANPLLHADCLLGIGTGNIIWSNYEAAYYFFPTQVKDPDLHPSAIEIEMVEMLDGPKNAAERAERWERLLTQFHGDIDVLIVWGSDPQLDALNERWFEPRVQFDRIRVLRHRPPARVAPGPLHAEQLSAPGDD